MVIVKTFLERWYKDDKYRKSLSNIGWTEEQIRQYDAIAWEDHSCVASTEKKVETRNLGTFL